MKDKRAKGKKGKKSEEYREKGMNTVCEHLIKVFLYLMLIGICFELVLTLFVLYHLHFQLQYIHPVSPAQRTIPLSNKEKERQKAIQKKTSLHI